MKIDYAIVLSAGFGTRMKSIGQLCPKPLWPVFEKTILELQINYARMLGAKEVFVNVHFLSDQIINHFHSNPEYEDVHFLVEKDILDIGGAVHNLASLDFVNYKGRLMILNGDQFIYFDWKRLEEAQALIPDNQAVMMAVKVDSRFGHGQTLLDDEDRLIKIVPNKEIKQPQDIYTYSGMAFLDLEKLTPSNGKSSLYETVANYKEKSVKMVRLDEYEYWDFGTIDRYWNSMFNIMEELSSGNEKGFVKFLIENNALDLSKLDRELKSYFSSEKSINLESKRISLRPGQILISSKRALSEVEKQGVIYEDLHEEVSFSQNSLLT